MFAYMRANSDVWVGFSWWAAGPLWKDYIYGVEPNADGSGKPIWNSFLKNQFAGLAKRDDNDDFGRAPARPLRLRQ
ncbi:hypothetical protein DFJ77DRAFT_450103 [Powellomyces hirtus]|nr:hypothetical protein DFJ77DRAFT_450103 [Powellomyces hirtus]